VRPPQALAAFDQANALRRDGRLGEAAAAYRRAVALDPRNSNAHYNLGIVLRQQGDLRGAAIAFRDAARANPADMDAVQNVIETLAQAVERDSEPLLAPVPARACAGGAVSIVVCSIDPGRLERMQASYRQALGEREHEFVVIRDARSLCEGYQRGLEASRYPVVVFSHDDVELATADFFPALDRALEDHDVAGVAGSTLVNGPAVTWAGHPHLHGGVGYPPQAAGQGWKATTYSLRQGIVGGIQSLDGVVFAARREAARAIGFDAATFDGFHFYDLDFSYRAHLAGLRIAVTTEALVIHASTGQFDDAWHRYGARFKAKFPALDAPLGPHFFFGRDFATREQMVRFYGQLRALESQR
jgi:tetratricopeptide (TPR) repeat protein